MPASTMPNPAFDNHLSDVLQQKVHAHGWIYFIHRLFQKRRRSAGIWPPSLYRDAPCEGTRRRRSIAVQSVVRAALSRVVQADEIPRRAEAAEILRLGRRAGLGAPVPFLLGSQSAILSPSRPPRPFVYSHICIHSWSMGSSIIIWKDSSASAAIDRRPRARRKNTPTARE